MADAKATSLDVARLAGVSQSAVSRVFTPGGSASKKTAEKVKGAAEELGYQPNVLARAMASGRSRMIGLVVAYLDNPFYPVALEGLSNALQAEGYHVLVFMAGNGDKDVSGVLEELLGYQVDGIITASVAMSNGLTARCDAAGIPVVMFNRGQDDPRLSEVTSDNVAGGRKVAEFLLAGGHKRIAHITGWQGSSTGRDRAQGFAAGMAAAGVAPVAEVDGMYKRDVAARVARQMFTGPEVPDAVFVGNDHMAFAVLDVLRHELGLSVPGDVSVIGYDDVPLAAWPAYNLTTMRQSMGAMVEATVDAMIARIRAPQAQPEKVRIAGPLIVRGSARIPEGYAP